MAFVPISRIRMAFVAAITISLVGLTPAVAIISDVATPTRAAAAPIPPSVTEFQPTLTATNPGAPAAGGKWGGRTVSISVDPADSNTAIAASESGGLWRTTDNGANWKHLDNLLPFRMADVQYAPNNASLVIATTFPDGDKQAPGGIWRSIDGGNTWTNAAPTLCGAINTWNAWGLAYEPSTNNVYAGTSCGLATSFDGGASWTFTAIGNGVVSLTAQNGGIVDTCDPNEGHRRYTRSGTTLTLTNGPSQLPGLNADGTPNPTGCDGGPDIHTLATAPQDPNTLLATVNNTASQSVCGGTAAKPANVAELFESDDSGQNWTRLGALCNSRAPWVVSHLSRDGNANHFDVFYSGGLDIYRATCDATVTPRCGGAPTEPTAHNVTIPHADPSQIAWDGTNCAAYEISDGGVAKPSSSTPPTCGDSFDMAAGSGSNGGYNAIQLYEVSGQVHPSGPDTNLYIGTQDNDIWASTDNGTTWPTAVCCEGFYFQTPHSAPTLANQVANAVVCAGCNNQVFHAAYGGCSYNPCAGSLWANPPVPPTGTPPTAKTDNPWLLEPNTYIESGIVDNTGNRAFYLGTVNPVTLVATWSGPIQKPGGGNFLLSQAINSRAYVSGPPSDPTFYYTYCKSNCGFTNQTNGLLKVTGLRSGNAVATTVDTGLSNVASYCNGQGTWVCPMVVGVDPNNPLHLIVADKTSATNIAMKESTDGGATWNTDSQLTNAVTGNNRFLGVDPNSGSQAHVIMWSPTDPNLILVGTESNGVIVSTDGGVTWAQMVGSQSATAVSFFFFDEVKKDILVSTYGRGLWKLALPNSDLSITKTDSPDPVIAGTPLTYTLTATNNGPDGAPVVKITDTLPAQVKYITNDLPDPSVCSSDGNPAGETLTCAMPPMASGDSITFHIQVDVKANAISTSGPTSITNTATISGAGVSDGDLSNNTAVATTIVNDSADVSVAKMCKPDDAVIYAGTSIKCTVFITNAGPSYARAIRLDDTILSSAGSGGFTVTGGTVTGGSGGGCNLPVVINGGQRLTCLLSPLENASGTSTGTATVTYTITGITQGQSLDNTAIVSASTPDPDASNNSATVNLNIQSLADLGITKAGTPDPVVAGTNETYTLTASNTGPSTATNILVTDNLPAGVTIVSVTPSTGSCQAGTPGDPLHPTTCNLGSLASGAPSPTVTIVVSVLPQVTGSLHNDASISSDTFDANTSNNLAHTDTTVNVVNNLTVVKAATPNPVIAGNALSYQITVTNNGPSTATGVILTDPLNSVLTYTGSSVSGTGGSCGLQTNTNIVQCQLPNLDPGQNAVVFIYTIVSSAAADGSSIANTATATSTAGGSASNVALITGVIRRSDLGVALTSDKDVYKPSTVIHYTITASNGGPSDANNVSVTLTAPPAKVAQFQSVNILGCTTTANNSATTVVCPLGVIVAGGSKTYQVNFLIRGNKGLITSVATVSSSSVDPNSANNSSTRNVTVK
jgi:uncharacterized repeat protein (TIGR01451 family)